MHIYSNSKYLCKKKILPKTFVTCPYHLNDKICLMKNLANLSILLLTVSTLISCHKNDVKPDDDSGLTLEQRMNKFIAKEMQDIYLWSDQIKNPNDISINQKPADHAI